MASLRAVLTGALIVLGACEDRSVVAVDVASVDILPATFTLVEGESRAAQAVPRGPEGETLTGRSVTWATDAGRIATVDDTGMLAAVGAGETTLRATVEGVTGSAPVTVLTGPSVALSRTAVSFTAVSGDDSGTETVTVTNGGHGVLSGLSLAVTYAAGEPSGWLTAGLSGTTAPAELSMLASARALAPGSYGATVAVTSAVGAAPRTVAVAFQVAAAPPSIVLDIVEISFSATAGGQVPAIQQISVTNGGNGVLAGLSDSVAYADGEPADWLRATLAAAVAPTTLRLEAYPVSLAQGTYHATVLVRSAAASNSPRTLAVLFEVAAAGSGAPVASEAIGPTGGGTAPGAPARDADRRRDP
jgi:Bacterial Ig-like domain (group 2)